MVAEPRNPEQEENVTNTTMHHPLDDVLAEIRRGAHTAAAIPVARALLTKVAEQVNDDEARFHCDRAARHLGWADEAAFSGRPGQLGRVIPNLAAAVGCIRAALREEEGR